MKRILFYILQMLAFMSRLVSNKLYMSLTVAAHKSQDVKFEGMPEYIHQDVYLDASGGLTIGADVVISTKVIILSHDWSYLKRPKLKATPSISAYKPVVIGTDSFIGAGAILLPGTTIGKGCIVGAGAVVKGKIEDFAIVAGNPAAVIGDTRR